MATKTIRIDDLDGSTITDESIQPLKLKVGKDEYSLDLSAANTVKFMDFLEGRKTLKQIAGGGRASSGSSSPAKSTEDLDAIRTWARANGHEVANQGRVAQKVKDAYYAAQGK